jgi:alginate O-acetyltransferase complex protein AlgI
LVSKKNTTVRWIIYYILAFALFTMGGFNTDTFVYLQF